MIAEIIPAIKLPRQFKYFDYSVPEELGNIIKIGQIVQIPFRGKNVEGLVYKTKEKSETPEKNLKKIIKIYFKEQVFDPQDIGLIKWLANYYFVSWGFALKQFIPEIPQKKSEIKEPKIDIVYFSYPKIAPPFPKIKILPKDSGVYFYQYQKQEEKLNLYLKIIKRNKKKSQQTLILSPTLAEVAKLNNFFIQYFKNDISLFLNNLPKGTFYNEWLNILTNKKKIILGTRSAIFAPLKNIGEIIFDMEFSDDFKQEEPNPRYDARSLAIQINKFKKIPVIFTGPMPRLEIFHQIKNHNIRSEIAVKLNDKINIVDLKNEAQGGNYTLISYQLEQEIENALKEKKQIALLLNRRGGATYTTCRDCGYVFLCKECGLSLAEHGSVFKCSHCNTVSPIPSNCPQCRGVNFNFGGRGTQKIEETIKNLFPKVKYLRLDKDVDLKNIDREKIKNADIIIGTRLMLAYLDWQNIGLFGILNFDNFLIHSDFRADEKKFGLIADINSKFNGRFFIQTYSPENALIKYAKNGDWQKFYTEELKTRKQFLYPPYSHLIKLIYQDVNGKKAEQEVGRIHALLKRKTAEGIDTMPPNKYFALKLRGKYRWNIVLRAKKEAWNNIPKLLKILPNDWIIDIDPQNLF